MQFHSNPICPQASTRAEYEAVLLSSLLLGCLSAQLTINDFYSYCLIALAHEYLRLSTLLRPYFTRFCVPQNGGDNPWK